MELMTLNTWLVSSSRCRFTLLGSSEGSLICAEIVTAVGVFTEIEAGVAVGGEMV
jgi:hypothetical protein